MKRVTKTASLYLGLCVGLSAAAGAAVADPVYGPPQAYGAPYPAPPPYPAPAYAPPPYADGVTVYGRPAPYRVPDHVQELSAGVAYDDLDLATRQGQNELNWRIARTADELCDRLGEGDEAGRRGSVLPTCQASARDGARSQVRRAVKDAQYAAAYAPPADPPYPPAGYGPAAYGPPAYAPPVYAPPVYAAPVYAPPVYAPQPYAQPQTAWTPPPCACNVAWVPPRAGW